MLWPVLGNDLTRQLQVDVLLNELTTLLLNWSYFVSLLATTAVENRGQKGKKKSREPESNQ